MSDLSDELMKHFENILGDTSAVNYDYYYDIDNYYNCDLDRHKWKWYEGFHMERFYFCEICDLKKPSDRI